MTHFSDHRHTQIGLEIKKLTQLLVFTLISLLIRSDVWKILLQVHTRLEVTQVYIEKNFNKNIEIGFQSASECNFSPRSASVSAIIAK